jgi:phosphoesterase RecJ-like protein
MVVMPEYKTGFITLTKQELEKFEYQQGDTEGLVNYPLMISGIIFSVLFIEKDDHVKLSLRSKGNFSVNTFARTYFNGGGHTNAAGGKINLSLKDAVDMFVKLLPKYTNQLNK